MGAVCVGGHGESIESLDRPSGMPILEAAHGEDETHDRIRSSLLLLCNKPLQNLVA